MAAPTLTLAASGINGTATTSHVVALPAGTADKVIWFLAFDAAGLTAPNASAAGWTVAKTYAISQSEVLYVLTRAATSETSVTVTTVESSFAAWVGGSTDGDIANAVFSAGVTGSGATNDPDAVTVDLGDYRVGAMVAYFNGARAISSYPTNYTDNQVNPRIAGNSRPGLGLATRGLTGITTEDPGAFGMHGGSGANIAGTVAIPEAGGAAPEEVSVAASLPALEASASLSSAASVSGAGSLPVLEMSATIDVVAVTEVSVTATLPALEASTSVTVGWPGGLPEASVIAWWDARHVVGSQNDPISSWADIGPIGQNPLATGDTTKRPLVDDTGFDGVRSLLFDGINDFLTSALAATYQDFAIIVVTEPLTYPTDFAAVLYSTGFIGSLQKNILGIDGVEPGFSNGAWVVMSGPEGHQGEHHHGTNWPLAQVIPGKRFVMSQAVRNAGQHNLWENAFEVINEADSAQGDNLNDLVGMRVGAREDESRPAHMLLGAILLIDLSVVGVGDTEVLDAATYLAAAFNVDDFAGNTARLDGVLPVLEASVTTDAVADMSVAGELPALEAEASVELSSELSVAGTLPQLESAVTVEPSSDVAIAGVLPELDASVDVASSTDISVVGELPALEGSVATTASANASITADLPVLEMRITTGAVATEVTVAGVLPSLEGVVSVESSSDTEITGILPALEMSVDVEPASDVEVAGALPTLDLSTSLESSSDVEVAGELPVLEMSATIAESDFINVSVVGELPALEGSVTTTSSADVDVTGTLPALEASVTIAVEVLTVAVIGSLPALDLSATTTSSSELATTGILPELEADVATTSSSELSVVGALPELTLAVVVAIPIEMSIAADLPALTVSILTTSEPISDISGTRIHNAGSRSYSPASRSYSPTTRTYRD